MSYQTLVTACLILVIALDAWLWWFLYRRSKSNLSQKLLQWHLAGVLAWSSSILVLLYVPHSILAATAFATALFFAVAKYFFALSFPQNTWPRGWWHYVLALLTIPVAIAAYIPGLIFSDVVVVDGFYFTLENGPLAGIYSFFVTYFLLYPIFDFRRKTRHVKPGPINAQLNYLSYGMMLFFIVALVTNSILPVFFEIYIFNALGPILSIFLAGFIVYIISRHDFLDLQIIIQRSLIYTTILSFIVAVYIVMLYVFSSLLPFGQIVSEFVGSVMTIIIGIATVPRLDTYLRERTDRWLFKGKYSFRETIHELSELTQSTLDADTLIKACEEKLAAVLRAKKVTIATKDFERPQAVLHIPIRLQGNALGVIAVDEKVSGDRYTETDEQLLSTFANQAATALGRIFLYQEVRRRAEELEIRVKDRTQELQSLQEQQRQSMLHISHNLQTPLAILQNKIDTLKNTFPESQDVLTLETSLEQLSHFMHDLLRLERLEAGYEDLTTDTLNLSALLNELADDVTVIAEPEAIAIVRAIDPHLTIHTDARKLREVVMNLLSNAVKYMGEQTTRTITITASEDNETITIAVTDTGIGIGTDDLTTVFNRFDRGHTVHKKIGTGLGLAITKELMERLGGTINAKSERGIGSTFSITLPKT